MLQELFKYDPQHPEVFRLPKGVVPLCNNSSLDRIRAMMPLCDSHGIVPTWQEPADDVVQQFFDGLVEVPICPDKKDSLTRDTIDAEMTRIANRLEEAAAAAAAGEFGFTVEEADAAEVASHAERREPAGEKELAGHGVGSSEPAKDTSGSLEINSSSSSSSGSSPQAEPPSPPRRRLRKAGDVAERQAGQQSLRRVTRSTAANTVAAGAPHVAMATGAGSSRTTASAPTASHAATATGAGSSQTTATVPAKRPRETTPPSLRARREPDFDFSVFSSDKEEEEE